MMRQSNVHQTFGFICAICCLAPASWPLSFLIKTIQVDFVIKAVNNVLKWPRLPNVSDEWSTGQDPRLRILPFSTGYSSRAEHGRPSDEDDESMDGRWWYRSMRASIINKTFSRLITQSLLLIYWKWGRLIQSWNTQNDRDFVSKGQPRAPKRPSHVSPAKASLDEYPQTPQQKAFCRSRVVTAKMSSEIRHRVETLKDCATKSLWSGIPLIWR